MSVLDCDTSIADCLDFFCHSGHVVVKSTTDVVETAKPIDAKKPVLHFESKFGSSKIINIEELSSERILFSSLFDVLLSTIAYIPHTREFWLLKSLMISNYRLPGMIESISKLSPYSFVLCVGYRKNDQLVDVQPAITGSLKQHEESIHAALRETKEEAFLQPRTVKFEGEFITPKCNVHWYSAPIVDCKQYITKKKSKTNGRDQKKSKVGMLIYGSEEEMIATLRSLPIQGLVAKRESEAYLVILHVQYLLQILKKKSCATSFWCKYPFL